MSASRYTEQVINCDGDGCIQTVFGGATLNLAARHTAAEMRRILRRRGWVVNMPASEGGRVRRDFCPEHSAFGRFMPKPKEDDSHDGQVVRAEQPEARGGDPRAEPDPPGRA